MIFFEKIYSICRENSDMAEFWPFKTKIWPFFVQNWQFWEFLIYNFQMRLWIFPILVWKLFLLSSLSKSYSICLENSDLEKFWPFKTKIWPFFGQNWLFWEFLTYNFQTQLWIFLIFGMELLWILTLSGEPITLCLVGHNSQTLHWIFMKLGTKLHLGEAKKNVPSGFLKNSRLAVFGHFWPKNQVFELFFQNAHQNFT